VRNVRDATRGAVLIDGEFAVWLDMPRFGSFDRQRVPIATSMNENPSIQVIHVAASRLLAGSETQRDVMLLANACQALAASLIALFHRRHLSHFSLGGYDASSFAWRCIEELFIPRSDESCHELRKYLMSLFPDGSPADEELAIALRRIVSRKISQTVPELYGELDPHFGRILRGVKRRLRTAGQYELLESVNGAIAMRANSCDPLLHLSAPPEDTLMLLLSERADPGITVSVLVDLVFDALGSQSEFRRALPLMVVAMLINDHMKATTPRADMTVDPVSTNSDREHVRAAIDKTVALISRTIIAGYVRRKRFSLEDGENMRRVLDAALQGLADGDKLPLFEHFKKIFPFTPYREYRQRWRIRLEYLYSTAKENLIAEFCENHGEKQEFSARSDIGTY